ncbi:MAG: hypothetical protein GY953_04210 [bacterium]|nr:hypothetical protein [bacterium]
MPRLPVAMEALDLREAEPDLVAGYAMIRRYLFDYRVDLETPLSLLIDAEGRMRKIYAEVPDVETAWAAFRWSLCWSAEPGLLQVWWRVASGWLSRAGAAVL